MQKKLMKFGKMLLLALISVGLLLPVQANAAGYIGTAVIPVEVRQEGSGIPQGSEYTVKIRALDENAPMPAAEDSEGGLVTVDSIQITDAGTDAFPAITYSHPGVYEYEVWQEAEPRAHFTYDGTVYRVKITVTNAEDGGLDTTIAVRKNDGTEEKTEIIFVNRYSRPADPEGGDGGGDNGGSDDEPEVIPVAAVPPAQTPQPPLDPGTPAQTGFGPQTGDSANAVLWLAAAALGGLVILVMVFCGKQKSRKEMD